MTGRPSAVHASLMPSTTSENCHITSGCSGLPKFRQLTSAFGARAGARDVAGRLEHREPAARARARARRTVRCRRPRARAPSAVASRRRSTLASPPGPTTVLRNSWWSYWRYTHAGSAMFGDASSASSSATRSVPGGNRVPELGARVAAEARVVVGRAAPAGGGTRGPSPRLPIGTSAIGVAVRRHRGRLVAERRRRVLARHADRVEEPVVDAEPAGVGDPADDRRPDLPAFAEREDLVEVLGRDDRQHPLLALGREHLDRVHARLALRRARHVDVHARAGLRRGLGRRARDPGRAEVLHADREAGVEQREARLDELLLLERVAHLHRRSLGLAALLEPGRREHAGAADAVAAGRRAEQHREVADALGAGEHQPLDRQHAETEDVDERVVAVALVEHELAADGRDADRVAVAADPADHALEQVAGARVVERTEAQRVHQRDRAGAHREDVADDAADAGGRALVRLDRGRVVVALDPDRDRDAVADVDDARRPRPDRRAPTAPRSGSGRGAAATTCRSSAPTTSPSTSRARGASAPARARRPPPRARRRSCPAARAGGSPPLRPRLPTCRRPSGTDRTGIGRSPSIGIFVGKTVADSRHLGVRRVILNSSGRIDDNPMQHHREIRRSQSCRDARRR